MEIGVGQISFGAAKKGRGAGPNGPRLLSPPEINPPGVPTAGVLITLTSGSYAPRGDGTLSLSHSWQIDGIEVSNALSFMPNAAEVGAELELVETATESGGSKDGEMTRVVLSAPIIRAALWDIQTTGAPQLSILISPEPPLAPTGAVAGQIFTFS